MPAACAEASKKSKRPIPPRSRAFHFRELEHHGSRFALRQRGLAQNVRIAASHDAPRTTQDDHISQILDGHAEHIGPRPRCNLFTLQRACQCTCLFRKM
jgi:hypothetical protein